MKTNLPVTAVEQAFPKGQTIVSKTDLKGAITYANDTFIRLSGFSAAELLGNNHNMVRHPDMPPEAFSDLWTTIKAGNPWRGIVKNRCKNGDYYWVKALVVPVRKNSETIGYMSVRTEPTLDEKTSAAELYRKILDKKARLKKLSLADLVFRFSFNTRFSLFVALMFLLTMGAGFASLAGGVALSAMFCAISFVAAVTSVWFMSATVSRPLKEAIGYFDRIAQGDLLAEIPVNRPDEVGRVLAGLATAQIHMRVMIDEIRISADSVENRCGQLDQVVRRVTELSLEEADRVTQVSAAMDELSSSVSEVAQTAAGAADSAKTTLEVVNEGNLLMTRSIAATDNVAGAVQSSGQHIEALSTSIGQIGTMAGMIKDIADQTNLLALNAAIEAARAGEQGRGFAVVADEVRKLAERTASATEDINKMVGNVQADTRSAAAAMGNAIASVQQGRDLISQTHESFKKITSSSERVTEISESIAEAALEQSAATGEVADNTEKMSHLIEQNSASITQVRDAVGELKETADQLRVVVAHFRAHT